jgi:hypothetical protein
MVYITYLWIYNVSLIQWRWLPAANGTIMPDRRLFHAQCIQCGISMSTAAPVCQYNCRITRNDHYTNLCCWHDVLLYNNHHFTPEKSGFASPSWLHTPSSNCFVPQYNCLGLSKNGVPQNPIKPSKFPRILVYHQNHSKPINHKSIPIKNQKKTIYISW